MVEGHLKILLEEFFSLSLLLASNFICAIKKKYLVLHIVNMHAQWRTCEQVLF